MDSLWFVFDVINPQILSLVGTIIIILFVVGIYYFTGSMLFAVIFALPALLLLTFMGIIPIWVSFCFASMIITYSFIYGLSPDSYKIDEQTGKSEWDLLGDKLKLAYSAKFGGANKGFEQEVDHRINVMNNMGRGFTRTIAYDWLKRMKKFTECK